MEPVDHIAVCAVKGVGMVNGRLLTSGDISVTAKQVNVSRQISSGAHWCCVRIARLWKGMKRGSKCRTIKRNYVRFANGTPVLFE